MYGKITVGYGTCEQKELQVTDFVQAQFKDHRLISIAKIEDGSFSCVVENPKSSGRNIQTSIWLSKESLIGLISTAMMYFINSGEDMRTLLEKTTDDNKIRYWFSDNLKDNISQKKDNG